MAKAFDSALYGVCEGLRRVLMCLSEKDKAGIFEIRLRADRPVLLTTPQGRAYLGSNGSVRFVYAKDCLSATANDVRDSFDRICEYSLQTHENELKNGYISMKHGHRAGVGGEGVVRNGEVVTFRRINSINIRIARTISGVAAPVIRMLYDRFQAMPATLIFGPPGCGKTTLLRDMAAKLAGDGRRVVLIDEKGELSGAAASADYDIISGIDKATAAEMAIRNLNPEFILFDEIGNAREAKLVRNCFHCGVTVITTLHAGNFAELCAREITRAIAATGGVRAAVYLQSVGARPHIYDMEESYEAARTAHPVCYGDPDRLCEKPVS